MAEYIDREAALENALAAVPRDDYFDRQIEFFINHIPAADVRPVVHSKWEQVEVLYVTENPNNMPEAIASMFCPKCKRYHNEVFFYGNPVENVNFCPNCGADMRETGDGA